MLNRALQLLRLVNALGLWAGLLLSPAATHGQVHEWRLEPVWRLGDANRENYDLSMITGVGVDRSGNVYVGQSQESTVRVYDGNGRFLKKIGRKGRGPGELESVGDVFVRNDTIYIVDVSQLRMLAFNTAGTFLKQWNASELDAENLRRSPPQALLRNGNIVTSVVSDTQTLDIYMSEGSRASRVARVPHQTRNMTVRAGRVKMSLPRPVSWTAFWRALPSGSGIVVVTQPQASAGEVSHFSVVKYAMNGDTISRSRFRYTAQLVPRAMWDSLVMARLATTRRISARVGTNAADLVAQVRDQLATREVLPPIEGLVVALTGAQWLRLATPNPANATWLVLNTSGDRIGQVKMPGTWTVEAVDTSYAYVSLMGEYDVPVLIKMRIVSQ